MTSMHVQVIIQIDGKPHYFRFPRNQALVDAVCDCEPNGGKLAGFEWRGKKRGDYVAMWVDTTDTRQEVPQAAGDSKDFDSKEIENRAYGLYEP